MKNSLLLLAMLAVIPAFSQRIISPVTIQRIEARMTDLKSSLFLVDSLYKDYTSNGSFLIQDSAKSDLFHSGSSWIYNRYDDLGDKYQKTCKECNGKKDEVMRLMDQEIQAAGEIQYQKIIKKADDCFQQRDFLKAKEYYQRAVNFMPSDPYPKNKLEEVDVILAEQEKKAKQ